MESEAKTIYAEYSELIGKCFSHYQSGLEYKIKDVAILKEKGEMLYFVCEGQFVDSRFGRRPRYLLPCSDFFKKISTLMYKEVSKEVSAA